MVVSSTSKSSYRHRLTKDSNVYTLLVLFCIVSSQYCFISTPSGPPPPPLPLTWVKTTHLPCGIQVEIPMRSPNEIPLRSSTDPQSPRSPGRWLGDWDFGGCWCWWWCWWWWCWWERRWCLHYMIMLMMMNFLWSSSLWCRTFLLLTPTGT